MTDFTYLLITYQQITYYGLRYDCWSDGGKFGKFKNFREFPVVGLDVS